MKRFIVIAALLTGACGAADDRPRTLAYITEAILTPSCASAQCHSEFKQQVGDRFDTVEAARASIVGYTLVRVPEDAADPDMSLLIQSLTVGVPSILDPGTTVRMPYDAPLPDADLDLIRAWIADGAEGAQCLPNAQGRGCYDNQVVECVDGNAVSVVEDCRQQGESCSLFSGNGRCVNL